jgi:hypothetical protein
MKKILILTAVLVLAAGSSFAAVTATASSALDFDNTGLVLKAGTGASIGKCSTGVAMGWETADTGYALISQHKSGTKAYASSFDSTAIYVSVDDAEPGTAAGALTASDTTDFLVTADWKAM